MTIDLEMKIAVLLANARSTARVEAEIAKEQIAKAKAAFNQAMVDIEERLDLEGWKPFESQCSGDDIKTMILEAKVSRV